MRKRVLAVCLPVLVLVVTAGCSTSNGGKGVAAASGAAAPSATPSLSVLDQGRRHAQCMRDHGVPEADPRVQPDGGVSLGGGYDKKALDPDVVAKAIAACKQYQVVLSPGDQAKKLEGARERARCMRAHGVESFPDPDPNDLGKALPDAVREDPQYDQAKEACQTRGASQSPGVTHS
jgi:hypothetical protein